MRSLVARATLSAGLLLSSASAHADVHWTGPGWYVVEDNPGGLFLIFGPVGDEPTCIAAMPPDEEEAIFECKVFQEKPSWAD